MSLLLMTGEAGKASEESLGRGCSTRECAPKESSKRKKEKKEN